MKMRAFLAAAIATATLLAGSASAAIFHLNFCGTYTDGSGGGVDGCIFYNSNKVTDAGEDFGLLAEATKRGVVVPTKIESMHPTYGDATFTYDDYVTTISPTMAYMGATWPELVKGWEFLDMVTGQIFLAVFPVAFVDSPVDGAVAINDYLTLVVPGVTVIKDEDVVELNEIPLPLTGLMLITSLGGMALLRQKRG